MAEKRDFDVPVAHPTPPTGRYMQSSVQRKINFAQAQEPLTEDTPMPIVQSTQSLPLVVVAIDFGTTYSGYAFATRKDILLNPPKISANNAWIDTETGTHSFKTPTSVLFNKEGQFHSFGYDAENKHAELLGEDKEQGWKFFKCFKMHLFDGEDRMISRKRKIQKDMTIPDAQNKRFPAMEVFSKSIRYLREHFLNCFEKSTRNFSEEDVKWVLTIPAIWDDPGKQFMREAAMNAGIKSLSLVLEPEAAAIFSSIDTSTIHRRDMLSTMNRFGIGEKFILVDCGGGTVDITSEEVTENGLKEICLPTGGPWGGNLVTNSILEFFEKLFGTEVWDQFCNTCPDECNHIYRNIEVKKKTVEDEFIMFSVPCELRETFEKVVGKPINKGLNFEPGHCFYEKVFVKKDKLKIHNSLIKECFKESIQNILQCIESLFHKDKTFNLVVLVGGYAESDYLFEKVKSNFPQKEVMRPRQSSLAVLSGAVVNGFKPHFITSRHCPRTYGISISVPWNPLIHSSEHYVKNSDGSERCEDIFKVIKRLGDEITDDNSMVEIDCRPSSSSKVATVEIYSSSSAEPMYITEGKCLGEVRIETKLLNKEDNSLKVQMHFGDTELKVTLEDKKTGDKSHKVFLTACKAAFI